MARKLGLWRIAILFLSVYIGINAIFLVLVRLSTTHSTTHGGGGGSHSLSMPSLSDQETDHKAAFLVLNQEEDTKSSSLSILLEAVRNVNRPIPDGNIHNDTHDIDPIMAMDLCNNFKCGQASCLSYNSTSNDRRTTKRRIFSGGLIADDSWHAIGTSALETYGMFHSITFIESNRTQSFQPRELRFVPGSEDHTLLTSGIYGPHTSVNVHTFVHEHKELPMTREHMMRNAILQQWKELGMTRDDVGIIMDVDEIPSRHTLRALQICHVQNDSWDTSEKQTCRRPLIRLSVPMFEGSPKCLQKRFLNPTLVIGACIEGIGDGKRHDVGVQRVSMDVFGNNAHGGRKKGYGEGNDYSAFKKKTNGDNYYPLYNGADFRRMKGRHYIYGGAGFHLHNFFDSIEKLRFKYRYYGHIHNNALTVPLGAMNADLMVMVKCIHNVSDDGDRKRRLVNGLKMLEDEFELPAAFQLPGYIDKRHAEIKALVEEDELQNGRADKFDGHHLYGEHMITHPGRRQTQKKHAVTIEAHNL